MKKMVAFTLTYENLLGQILCVDNTEIQTANVKTG